MIMGTLISKMTENDLKLLIKDTVKETLYDYFEDMTALMSDHYKKSISKSRKEYESGETFDLKAFK